MTQFTQDFSKEVWEETYKYFKNEVDVDSTFRRTGKAIASVEKTESLRKEYEDKFSELLEDFKITLGGRIYANAGTEYKGTTLINCFVGPRDGEDLDSLDGILKTLREQVHTLRSEGGWGMNFSFIRPRGAFVKGIGVESPGSIEYIQLFNTSSRVITAGSGRKSDKKEAKGKIRKGAMMAILDCWHPDVEEFITSKQKPGVLDKFNISVNCSNEFMDKLIKISKKIDKGEDATELNKWNLIFPDTTFEHYKKEWDGNINKWKEKNYPIIVYKTVKVTDLWNLIMESTYKRNDPGVFFGDRANYTHCWNYGENSYIGATNPCLIAESKVLTKIGIKNIIDINTNDIIWSKQGWTKVINKLSSGIKKSFKYTTTFGSFKGTEDHKIISNNNKLEINKAKSIDILRGPDIQNISLDPQDIIDGLVIGDGTWHKANNYLICLCIGNNDSDYFNSEISSLLGNKYYDEFYRVKTTILKSELDYTYNRKVPARFLFGNFSKVCGFLRGIYSANGSLCGGRVTLKSSSIQLIEDIQILLSIVGISAYYTTNKPTKVQFKNGEYLCKESYDLNITRDKEKFFQKIGFIQKYKTEKLNSIIKKNSTNFKKKEILSKEIVSKEYLGEQEVFDITVENIDHTFWCDGLNIANCGEQALPYGSTCNLLSINLTQFLNADYTDFDYDKLKKYIPTAIRLADNVNDYSNAPLPQYVESLRKRRRIGLGILGWGSALYLLKTRFGSNKAEKIKSKLMECITHTAIKASIDLAKEKGCFEDCDKEKHANHPFWKQIGLPEEYIEEIRKYGIRNSAIFSFQPTGNTAVFANLVSGGMESVFCSEFIRTVIVSACPDILKDKVPKYWEGDYKENKYFKSTKEGSDDILKYTHDDGIVYKIDKNRGLTKEVLCEDYAVKILKAKNEWDAGADWAVSTSNLSVDEHIKDMTGFGRWIDSSMSKTVNVPNDYPYEDFKTLYIKAFQSGVLKGITTYRAGTMMSVLAAVEDKKDIIKYNDSPKREKELPADVFHMTRGGQPYFILIGLLNGLPFEVFAGKNSNESVGKDVKTAKVIKIKSNKYKAILDDDSELSPLSSFIDAEEQSVTKLVSMSLRHGAKPEYIVHLLEKDKSGLTSLSKVIAKALSKYVKESFEKCPNCDTNLLYSEGCKSCKNCGFSKC